jgi:quinolinate synthase
MITTEAITAEQLYQELVPIQDEHHNPVFSRAYCEEAAPLINEINDLKKEKDACILAHSYVTADIIYGVSDFAGDSYELSKKAKAAKASTIVFAGVRFMGETAKLLSPDKAILVPATDPGCTLADAITGETVKRLREENPDHTFVCYINTTADVKAACDVCVTSSNIYKVVERLPSDKIFFIPDELMAQNLINYLKKHEIPKTVKYVKGTCYLHEDFEPELIDKTRQQHPDLNALCHPECKPAVCEKCDFVGSTSQMLKHVQETGAGKFLVLTDNGITARLQHDDPAKEIVGPSLACKYMKSNTLKDILRVLKDPQPRDHVEVPPMIRDKALACINAMFTYAD